MTTEPKTNTEAPWFCLCGARHDFRVACDPQRSDEMADRRQKRDALQQFPLAQE